MTRTRGWLAMLAAAAALTCASTARAQLYSETFPKVGPGDAQLSTVGWDATSTATNSAAMFDHTGSGLTNEAQTGDGVDAGTAFHYRNSNGAQMIWTTEFSPITPGAGGVDIVWFQVEDALIQGSTIDVHPAVNVGGQWYAPERAFTTADTQIAWQRNVLPYTTTAANWRQVTLNVGNVTIGAAPGANLAGDIAGLGLITVFNSAQIGNEAVWYDYIEISNHLTPGDVNGVGGVTIDDFNIIKANYRTNVASRALGDLNADGFVDILDFREWKTNYPNAAEVAGLEIPEPTGVILTALGIACGLMRRRAARRERK